MTQDQIITTVANFYRVSRKDLLGRRRTSRVAWPRQVAMYLCRKLTGASYQGVGDWFNRDHGTVMYACQRMTGLYGNELSELQLLERKIGIVPTGDLGNYVGQTVLLAGATKDVGVIEAKIESLSKSGDYAQLSGGVIGWHPVRKFGVIDIVVKNKAKRPRVIHKNGE